MVKRVVVIGSPGAGKSTFARRLGALTGIPVHHLDRLYWKPGWVETPRPDWLQLQQELIQAPTWIIDGNYGATMEIRLDAADTVILLDFPRRVCLWRAVKRAIQYSGKTRPDMGADCPEKIDAEFLRYIWNFRTRQHTANLQRLEEARAKHKQVIVLTSNAAVEGWFKSLGEGTRHAEKA